MTLALEDLAVDRGRLRVVAGVRWSIGRGWTGLVGPNGSGKTSLLRAVAGRLPAAAGRIVIDGAECSADREGRARAIGFAPDIAMLPDGLTGFEFLSLVAPGGGAAGAAGAGGGEEGEGGEARLAGLRAALGFDPWLHRPIGTLSAGMRQRLALFSAFVGGAATVFLDEPFNWLDPVCAFDTRAALRALVDAEDLVLVTALHDLATLTVHCDAGALLAGGRLRRLLGRDELAAGRADLAAFEAKLIADLRGG